VVVVVVAAGAAVVVTAGRELLGGDVGTVDVGTVDVGTVEVGTVEVDGDRAVASVVVVVDVGVSRSTGAAGSGESFPQAATLNAMVSTAAPRPSRRMNGAVGGMTPRVHAAHQELTRGM